MYFAWPFSTKKNLKVILTCALICIATGIEPARALTVRDVDFVDKIEIGGQELALHGVGLLKWKYLVKVYQVGLYKPRQVPINQVLRKDVPIRLEYYFFIDMKASDFQDSGFELMARNLGEEKAGKLSRELDAFNRLYRDVGEGQRYTLTHLPGIGLEIALDGKPLGRVGGDEFAKAYLSIWLGPDPVDKVLQEGMFNPATVSE